MVVVNALASLPFTYFEEDAFVMLPVEAIVTVFAPVVNKPFAKSRMPFTVVLLVSVTSAALSIVQLFIVAGKPLPVAWADAPMYS